MVGGLGMFGLVELVSWGVDLEHPHASNAPTKTTKHMLVNANLVLYVIIMPTRFFGGRRHTLVSIWMTEGELGTAHIGYGSRLPVTRAVHHPIHRCLQYQGVWPTCRSKDGGIENRAPHILEGLSVYQCLAAFSHNWKRPFQFYMILSHLRASEVEE